MERTQPRFAAAVLAVVIIAPTTLAWATGAAPASYRMFTRPERLDLVLVALTPRGPVYVAPARLAPHLTADARRVLRARDRGGAFRGEASAEALAHSLPGFASLLCHLVPDAVSARAVLERSPHGAAPAVVLTADAPCTPR